MSHKHITYFKLVQQRHYIRCFIISNSRNIILRKKTRKSDTAQLTNQLNQNSRKMIP